MFRLVQTCIILLITNSKLYQLHIQILVQINLLLTLTLDTLYNKHIVFTYTFFLVAHHIYNRHKRNRPTNKIHKSQLYAGIIAPALYQFIIVKLDCYALSKRLKHKCENGYFNLNIR